MFIEAESRKSSLSSGGAQCPPMSRTFRSLRSFQVLRVPNSINISSLSGLKNKPNDQRIFVMRTSESTTLAGCGKNEGISQESHGDPLNHYE